MGPAADVDVISCSRVKSLLPDDVRPVCPFSLDRAINPAWQRSHTATKTISILSPLVDGSDIRHVW